LYLFYDVGRRQEEEDDQFHGACCMTSTSVIGGVVCVIGGAITLYEFDKGQKYAKKPKQLMFRTNARHDV